MRPRLCDISVLAITVTVLVGACASSIRVAGDGPVVGDRVEIVALGTTDVHGRLVPWDYYTQAPEGRGLAKVATLVDSIRAAEPNVVLVDSGDLLQGNPLDYYYGLVERADVHPVVRAMNALEYDASALGNHEFNYGLEALHDALKDADFLFLAANVFHAGTDSLVWPAYTVVERSGVRVGILGLITPGVTIWDRRHVEGVYDFRDIVESAEKVWDDLEDESDVQIIAIHSGMGPGSSYAASTGVPEENAGQRLAEELPDIDVVFLGHSHLDVPSETINGVLFTQAGKWAEALAVARLTLERRTDGWSVVDKRAHTISTADVPAFPAFLDVLRPYHDTVVSFVADTIGWTNETWSTAPARFVDTPIIDLIQRVQREITGADLSAASAFTNNTRIGPGPITVADAAGLYIYDNTLKAIEITGAQLRDYLEYSARFFHQVDADGHPIGDDDLVVDSIPGYNYDMVDGVEYVIDVSQPAGSRIRDLTYEGAPVEDDHTFTMAINNYRQGGGGGFAMIEDAPVVYDRQDQIRQHIIDWISARDTLRTADVFEPSWRIVPEGVAEASIPGPLDGALETLPPPTSGTSDTTRVVILATNDFHGALDPVIDRTTGDSLGGAAMLASFIRAVEARYPGATVHLDGGDVMQGTVISNLTAGRSTVDVMNAIGLDAAAIGNHEFDWDVETLRARIEQADFPWLSANIFEKSTGQRPDWVEPYAWLNLAGLRVAVIGASTVSTPTTTMPTHVEPFAFPDIAEVVNELAPRLRAEGADLVLLAAHAGGFRDNDGAHAGEIISAAERITAPLDAIVSGHTHSRLETVVNGIPIVQARSSGRSLGIITLTHVAGEGVVDHSIDVWDTTHSTGVVADSAVGDLVAGYRDEVAEIALAPIASLAQPLRRNRSGESALGNLIADAQRAATGVEIAIVNGGGIRTDLAAGPVAFQDVFAVQPFENVLVRLELTGEQLKRALEAVVDDNIGQVSGVRFSFDPTLPSGQRVLVATLEEGDVPVIREGRPVEPDRIYTVTANNFMVSGGSGYGVLGEARSAINTGLVDSEVMVEYLAELPQPVRYALQERIGMVTTQPDASQ